MRKSTHGLTGTRNKSTTNSPLVNGCAFDAAGMALMALFGLLGIVVGVALVGFLVLTVWLAYKHNKYTHIPGPRRVR